MKKYKFLIFILAMFIVLCNMAACGKVRYNAELYDDASDRINEDFASENLVRISPDDDYPTSLTFIVTGEEEYNRIFKENIDELKVDFDKQMIIVYTFRTVSHRKVKLYSLNIKDDVLKITYKEEEKYGVGDASRPYQRWFAVKLDKTTITSVLFEKKVN